MSEVIGAAKRFPLNNASDAFVYPRWRFSMREDGLVTIDEETAVYYPAFRNRIAEAVGRGLSSLPHDDCGKNIFAERNDQGPAGGAFLVDIGLKGQLWTCFLGYKSISAEGTGFVRLTITPHYTANSQNITFAYDVQKDFQASAATKLGWGGILSSVLGPTGSIIPLGFDGLVRNVFSNLSINYPPIQIAVPNGEKNAPVKLKWINSKAPFFEERLVIDPTIRPSSPNFGPLTEFFPSFTSATVLVRTRTTSQRPALACGVHHYVESIQYASSR